MNGEEEGGQRKEKIDFVSNDMKEKRVSYIETIDKTEWTKKTCCADSK